MIRMYRLSRLVLKERIDVLTFIVGFAIGAGILGLPVRFGESGTGFLPSAAMLVIALFFQIVTAVYIVEGLDTLGPSEYPELMRRGLGRWAELLSYATCALYLVGAMTAYVVFGGEAIYTLSRSVVGVVPGMIIYWVIAVAIVLGGARAIARAEEVMVALIITLLAINVLMCLSTPYVSPANLAWGDWSKMFSVFGVVLFAYAIHSAIPTAYRSFGIDQRYERLIAAGLGISAAVYIVWSAAYMSILEPSDYTRTFVGALTGKVYHGLEGLPAPIAVAELGKLRVAALLGYIFGFFTTLTSFIAAAHALTQINLEMMGAGRASHHTAVLILTSAAPLALAISRIGNFIQWLSFAGSLGAGIFTGILPTLLAITLRIKKPKGFTPLMPGGLPLATITLGFYAYGIAWFLFHG